MVGGGSEEGMTGACEVLPRTLFRAVCLFLSFQAQCAPRNDKELIREGEVCGRPVTRDYEKVLTEGSAADGEAIDSPGGYW
jgi:hypothetical protein